MRLISLLAATLSLLTALGLPSFAADGDDGAQRPTEQVRQQGPKQSAGDSAAQSKEDEQNKEAAREPFFDDWPITLLLKL